MEEGAHLSCWFVYKTNNGNQYFHATVLSTVVKMSYSQTLHLKKISSENALFDKPCNDLEVWLKGWDQSDKIVTDS